MQPRVFAVLLVAVGVISAAAILIKLAEAPAIIIAAYRLGVTGVLVGPTAFALRRSELRDLDRQDWLLSLASGAFLSLHFIFWISSLQLTSVASSVILVTTNPIFVGLGSVFILRERLPRALIGGIVLVVLGGAMIGSGDLSLGGRALTGDLLALLGGIAHSGYLLIGQRVRAKMDALSYIAIVYGMAAVLTLIAAALSGMSFVGYPTMTYVWMVLLAIGPQIVGHSSYNWALRYVSAAAVAVLILGEPVGASILAFFILGEGLTWWKVVGGVLVLSGIYLATQAEREPRAEVTD
ncbi:MAG: DMT family transporter [Candidatus Bipolaricaulia bacterium]